MSTEAARNDQPGHLIERIDNGQPLFYSVTVGRNFGSPYNGWVSDRDQATELTKDEAEQMLAAGLHHVAPFCKVVPR
jgi:hypothetical protein